MADYVSAPDAELDGWQENCVTFAAASAAGLAKPPGVRGAQLWRKIGDPAPVNESELEFVSEFTRARMTLDYQMSQGGQTVYYQARWVSTRGDTGPWGELVSATVVK